MATKIQVAYLIIETREFEVEQDLSHKSVSEVLDICEFDIGFDKGKVVDTEILRSNLVSDDLPFPTKWKQDNK